MKSMAAHSSRVEGFKPDQSTAAETEHVLEAISSKANVEKVATKATQCARRVDKQTGVSSIELNHQDCSLS